MPVAFGAECYVTLSQAAVKTQAAGLIMANYTPAQGRYLAFIHAYMEGFGEAPAESEIAEALGVTPPSVNQMMKTLEKKDLIRRTPGEPRSIEILVPVDALPRWRKKVIRTVYQWMPPRSPRRPAATRAKSTKIYQLKIALLGIQSPIWRRIEVRDVALGELHEHIQTSMGWTNSHLHQFQINGRRYTHPRFLHAGFDDWGAIDYSDIYISDLVREHGPNLKLLYEYDFGDSWEHLVELEETKDAEPRQRYPRCTAGERACPPEDIGGIYGFAEYLEAIADSDHEQHEEYLEWNGPFDPDDFEPAETTRAMRKGLPAW